LFALGDAIRFIVFLIWILLYIYIRFPRLVGAYYDGAAAAHELRRKEVVAGIPPMMMTVAPPAWA
jgi:hypothetical protein